MPLPFPSTPILEALCISLHLNLASNRAYRVDLHLLSDSSTL